MKPFIYLIPGLPQLFDPVHLFRSILKAQMRAGVHRHSDVAVAHQVLESFGIHPRLGLIAAVCMPADVRNEPRHAPLFFLDFHHKMHYYCSWW